MSKELSLSPEKAQKLQEIFQDEEFNKTLFAMETSEEVQAALKERGLELTIDEIKAIAEAIKAAQEGELTEDNLEDVAGGSVKVYPYIPVPIFPWPWKFPVW